MAATDFHYTEFPSPVGVLSLLGTARGLAGVFMEEHLHGPGPAARAAWTRQDAPLAGARAQLEEYFAGARTAFDLALDLEGTGGTAFQRRVWAALREVPYGATISYGELARRIGQETAVRAVGLANGRNPLSIIVPCHRGVGAGGALTGYGGGMARKRALLDLEARASGRTLL